MKKPQFLVVLLLLVLFVWSCGPSAPEKAKESPAQAAPAPVPETPAAQAPVVAQEVPEPKAAPKVAAPEPAAVIPQEQKPLTSPTPAPVVPPAPAAVVKPAGPLTAPDLKIDPATGFQSAPVLVHLSAMPQGTIVKYTLDGTDPASGKAWPPGQLAVDKSARLRVWAASPGGPASTAEGIFTVGEVWVQTAGTGDGSWDHPLGTLEAAVAKATSLGAHRIRLFSGTFAAKADLTTAWDLSGGWKALGEADTKPTILQGTKQSGTTQKDPGYTVRVSGGKFSISNLEIRAPNSSVSAAVVAGLDATLEITGSRLVGGSGLYGYGLRASGATLVAVTDSTLSGGDGGSTFALSSEKSTIKALRSTFDGGTGNAVSYGLNLTLSKADLVSCVVWGGSGDSSYGVGFYSSVGGKLWASTILGGKGSSAWAVYLSESDPEIVDCLIGSTGKAKSYGVFVNLGKSLPRALRSNAFFGSASGAFTGTSLGKVSTAPGPAGAFLDSNGAALADQKSNVAAEPVLGPSPDFRTLPASPASILQGGEALGGEAATDRAQKVRGPTMAIGAWRAE